MKTVVNETIKKEVSNSALTMTMDDFIGYIGAGKHTANKIVEQAKAKIYIGRRVLINMEKVKDYLNDISE
ncbi:hypothetical protein [Faecalicatena contorta]|uniref:Excisionase family DNA binding protein n=1 Tax=Faecalicatena contorta TaxID=39482 RepID=A0A315ZZX1_9FIRM|nr:hypothetical protein [Faecalicatena contorta]PWJ50478.1 hypothetical protein A8805_104197 [Faecalicatena contorta]SUQ13886.1 hypothetical protein SAMN05216529_104197 [Faecalicatena contorta]